MYSDDTQKGIVLIEVVIAAAILLIISTGLIFANIAYIKSSSYTLASTKATFLAQEGVEAVKYIRSSGWEEFTTIPEDTPQYLSFTPSAWATTTPEEVIDGKFYRSFVVESVSRDANDDITTTGTDDPNSKKVTVNVSWRATTGTTTHAVATYITNLFDEQL